LISKPPKGSAIKLPSLIISSEVPESDTVASDLFENPFKTFTEFKSVSDPTADLYRETPVRLFGYANEVGESFQF